MINQKGEGIVGRRAFDDLIVFENEGERLRESGNFVEQGGLK